MNHPIPTALRREMPAPLLAGLQARFGDRLSTSHAMREHHGRDESSYDPMLPDAVVFALSTEDVAAAVALCNEHRFPVIAYGTGTSLEGHILAVQGGLSIDLSQMNQVVSVNPEDLTVTVQPGVTRKQLNAEIKDTGLFFPIDPGADASIGGMAATRASGTNAVRYGTMRENVLALTVVTAEGKIIRALFPLNVLSARIAVQHARQHEQQIRQAIHILAQPRMHFLVAAERDDTALGAPAYSAAHV